MLIEMMIAVSALAETSTSSTSSGQVEAFDIRGSQIVVVEGRPERRWLLPDLDYIAPTSCPALVETEIPGFGMMRIGQNCSPETPDGWTP